MLCHVLQLMGAAGFHILALDYRGMATPPALTQGSVPFGW